MAQYGSTSTTQTGALNRGPDQNLESFSQMSDTIGTNIFTINNGTSNLEKILKQIGTPKDNLSLRDSIHVTQQKTNVVIIRTTQLIRNLTTLAHAGDKQQKLRAERLRNEFRDAVERYTSLQKQMAEKIRTTYSFPKQESPWEEEREAEKASLIDNEANTRSEQQQLLKEMEFEQELIVEREQRIRQIEEDILDANQIFRDLGAMVHEQGEVINTIEANIDHAYHNVESGRSQLSRASEYQQKYRRKLCCFLVIIAIVAIILTITLVLTLKKS